MAAGIGVSTGIAEAPQLCATVAVENPLCEKALLAPVAAVAPVAEAAELLDDTIVGPFAGDERAPNCVAAAPEGPVVAPMFPVAPP